MGSSGSFGIGENCMLGLSLFDNYEQLESAKVISLQCGRHTIELRATTVDVLVQDKGFILYLFIYLFIYLFYLFIYFFCPFFPPFLFFRECRNFSLATQAHGQ